MAIEARGYDGQTSKSYWELLGPLLAEQGKTPEDYMRSQLHITSARVHALPKEIFVDPDNRSRSARADYLSPVKRIRAQLEDALSGRPTDIDAPTLYWRFKNSLEEAEDHVEGY